VIDAEVENTPGAGLGYFPYVSFSKVSSTNCGGGSHDVCRASSQTYTELLTCLEIAGAARKLPTGLY
jgi:hypothetical protein